MRGEQFVYFTADRFHFFVCRYDESGEPQIEDINAWFDELDVNKDGVVTLDEYKHYFLKPDENGHTVSVGSLRFMLRAVYLWIVLRGGGFDAWCRPTRQKPRCNQRSIYLTQTAAARST